jgi:hypothetical protein
MKYEIKYNVSEQMQIDSMKAYFFAVVLGKKWVAPVLIIFISTILLIFERQNIFAYSGAAFLTLGIIFILIWIRAYYIHKRHALDVLNLTDQSERAANLSEEGISIDGRVNNMGEVKWAKITKLYDTKNFIILMSNSVPVANLPKEFLTQDQIDFIRSKIHQRAV